MPSNCIFESSRLSIRRLVPEDFDAFQDMQSNEDVMRYTSGVPFSEAENRKQLQECIECYDREGNGFWVWAAVRRSDEAFIGTVALVPHPDGIELGYRIRRKFFGSGLGKELALATIDYAINQIKVEKLVAMADVRNVASVRILDASPMIYQGELITEEGTRDRMYCWTRRRARV